MAAPIPIDLKPGLSQVLSPSQVQTFFTCSAAWWFKYGLELPDPKCGNLSLGSAVHSAIAANLSQKIDSRQDLPAEPILAEFDRAWGDVSDETEFRDDEDPEAIRGQGRALVAKFLEEACPTIDPAAVEVPVQGTIAGVLVQGRIDVIERDGRILDIKTASKKPSALSAREAFQLATYHVLTPASSGLVQIATLVKTKTPQLIRTDHRITGEDKRALELQYPLAQEAMNAGLYMPNRASMLCSRRNCAFWRACEDEFGGQVPA
jgi:RecB family exonuclease